MTRAANKAAYLASMATLSYFQVAVGKVTFLENKPSVSDWVSGASLEDGFQVGLGLLLGTVTVHVVGKEESGNTWRHYWSM